MRVKHIYAIFQLRKCTCDRARRRCGILRASCAAKNIYSPHGRTSLCVHAVLAVKIYNVSLYRAVLKNFDNSCA